MSEKIRAASIVELRSRVDAETGGRLVTGIMQVGRKQLRFEVKGPNVRRALASMEEEIRGRGIDPPSLGPTHAELDALESPPV